MTGSEVLLAATLMLASVGGAPAAPPAPVRADRPAPEVTVVVLGVAQDGGVPHLGCHRACCTGARQDPSRSQRVASLGIIARSAGETRLFLVDATPDLRSQVDSLHAAASISGGSRPAGRPVDGILLTHAHIGHYTGLMYLGKESMAAQGVPVFGTPRMIALLEGNAPWRRLGQGGHVALRAVEPDRPIALAEGLTVTPLRVPHRDEDSDTVGFVLAGPSRRLLYIPDVDAWEKWDRDVAATMSGVDAALLDGTFHGADELPGRSIADVPHPLIGSTMDRLEPAVRSGRRVIFIHLNHSNPALDPASVERRSIGRRGFEVAADGMRIPL